MKRMRYCAYGISLCALAMYGTIQAYETPKGGAVQQESKVVNTTHNDGPAAPDSVLEQAELVPTGTSTIPYFPRTIHLSATPTATSQTAPTPSLPAGTTPVPDPDTPSGTEYQLLGLGIRTVSLLSIQVYVVGLYVASPDIAKLQERLIRTIDPVATTLVPGEKQKLREVLLDPEKSHEVWNELLKHGEIRTAFKIVPTRNTDFMHMRDGFVRGITARASSPIIAEAPEFTGNNTFGQSMNDFKAVFGGGSRKKIPYGQTLWLLRNAEGVFQAVHEDKGGVREIMGEVTDERVSRLLWLNYLAGKNVSSEDARKNIVEGAVEWTGRPVGTVATQVV